MILALLACRPPPEVAGPGPGSGWDHPVAVGLREGVPGFAVEEGRQQIFGGCEALIEELGHCLGNNAATPYVTLYLDDYDASFGTFTLDADQAVIWVGRTPPDSRYFSLTAAVHERWYDEGWGTPVGSIAGSLHLRNLRRYGPAGDPFERLAAVIATGDRSVADDLGRALTARLAAAGVDVDVVNVLQLPMLGPEALAAAASDPAHRDRTVIGLRTGHEAHADRFSLGWRVADADPDAPFFDGDRAEAAVFRLTPDRRRSPDPWDWPHLPPPRDADAPAPEAVQDALAAMSDALLAEARAEGLDAVRDLFSETDFDGFRCVELGLRCGNSDDAWYASAFPVELPVGLDAASVTYLGAIHGDLRHALGVGPSLAYANLTLQDATTIASYGHFFLDELRGTARARFPEGLPGVDDGLLDVVWVLEVARSCAGKPQPCVEVSADQVPDGGVIDAVERAYLDLGTGTGPHPAAMLASRQVVRAPELVLRPVQGRLVARP